MTDQGLYESVRLFCITIFLIAILILLPTMSRLYIAYRLTRCELGLDSKAKTEAPRVLIQPRSDKEEL